MRLQFNGSAMSALLLVEMLREEGLEVQHSTIIETKSVTKAAIDVVVWVTDQGQGIVIGAVVSKVIERIIKRDPSAKIESNDDE